MKQNRLLLNDVKWGEFNLDFIFNLERGNATNISRKKLNLNKGIPILSSKFNNNAITGFTSKSGKEKVFRNVLTINNNGSVGCSFYHKYSFIATSDVTVLIPYKNLSKEILLFVSSSIEKTAFKKFAYGYKASNQRLKKSKILLPIGEGKEPNWQFMEAYIKQEQKDIAQKVIDYYEQKMLETSFDLVGFEDVEWRTYTLGDIFSVEPVKGKTVSKYEEGIIPYVSTSSQNNGVSGFIETDKNISDKKCISIDPIAGNAFYHDYKFVGRGGAGSAINLLYNKSLNKYNAKFIISSLEKVSKEKASYGIALNGRRLKETKIILPTDKNGNPHWEYMSKFMQKIDAENIEKVLVYIYIYIYI